MQKQWRAIQRLIEAEEDRLIEECQKQRRRLSQMQKQERQEKALQLATIRQRLKRALEMEEVNFYQQLHILDWLITHFIHIYSYHFIISASASREGGIVGRIWLRRKRGARKQEKGGRK